MIVDRTRFLLITAALAGTAALAACTIQNADPTDAGSNNDAGSDASTDSGKDGGGDAGGDGGVCDDSVSTNDGGLTCPNEEGATPACGADPGQCALLESALKPRLRDIALTCVQQEDCDLEVCLTTALEQSCPDTTAAEACTTMIAACGADAGDAGVISQADCAKVVSGLTDPARESFKNCMEEPDTACQFNLCLQDVISPPVP